MYFAVSYYGDFFSILPPIVLNKNIRKIYSKSGNFRENLFSRYALKDIFATLKIATRA